MEGVGPVIVLALFDSKLFGINAYSTYRDFVLRLESQNRKNNLFALETKSFMKHYRRLCL